MSVKENLFVNLCSFAVILVLAVILKAFFPPPAQQDLIWLLAAVLMISASTRWIARKVFHRFFNQS